MAQLCSDIEQAHITRDAAAQYYSGHVGVKGYEIADAVAERRVADAVESLRYALLEVARVPGSTVSALATTLRRLAAAKSARHGPSAAADVAAAPEDPRVDGASGRGSGAQVVGGRDRLRHRHAG